MHPAVAADSLSTVVQLGKDRELLAVLFQLLNQLRGLIVAAGRLGKKQLRNEAEIGAHTNHPHRHTGGRSRHQVQARQRQHRTTHAPEEGAAVNGLGLHGHDDVR